MNKRFRPEKKKKEPLNFEVILQEIKDFIHDNNKEYAFVGHVFDPFFVLVAKKKTVQIFSRNTNNIFQPYETVKTHTHTMLCILADGIKKNDCLDALMRLDCPLVDLNIEKDFKKKLADL